MPFISHRKNSRTDWGRHVDGDENPDVGHIKLGCLLRIADASEAIAKNWQQLVAERDDAVAGRNRALSRQAALERSNRALRGHLTRLRRRDG